MKTPATSTNDNFVTAVTIMSSCMLVVAFCATATAGYVVEYAGNLQLNEGRHGAPRPVSVSADPVTGELCVSDAAGSALHVLHRDGASLFTTDRLAGLSNPADGAFIADGEFVFIDTGADHVRTIQRLDLRGEPVTFTAQSPVENWIPDHLTVLADGHLLSLDNSLGLLVKHHADTGAVIWQRALWNDTNVELVVGRPSEAPDGRLYVPVSQEHRILVLTSDGMPEDSFGVIGTTPGKFSFPVDVAFGPEGTVLVLDRMRHKVLIFDESHQFLTEYGRMGSSPGAFYHPVSIAYASGRAYVAQSFEGRVQVFDVFSTDAVNPERQALRALN